MREIVLGISQSLGRGNRLSSIPLGAVKVVAEVNERMAGWVGLPVFFGREMIVKLTAGAGCSIRLAHRVGAIDVPNERSSHAIPTPRMGGVPMVAAVLLPFGSWALLAAGEIFYVKGLPQTLIFALAMSVLGFWDDLSRLSPLLRFLVQFACATLLLLTFTSAFPTVPVPGAVIPKVVFV